MIPLIPMLVIPPNDPIAKLLPAVPMAGKSARSFQTGRYRSLFREIGKSDEEIRAKLNAAWNSLFEGDPKEERVYFESGDAAYIKDIGNNDVRSEGISYGMMLAVQYGRRAEFDRLWNWAKTKMRYSDGPWKGLFAWRTDDTGKITGNSPASDGEEYIVTSLFFASGRWKEPRYRQEADAILHAMLHPTGKEPPMFDLKEKQVTFVPAGDAAKFTDPSYHLPAFYELWARWAKEDRAFWKEAAATSRRFFKKAAHPETGLFSDYSTFDGKPMRAPWSDTNHADNFQSDAYRVGGNIGMDHVWFAADPWQVTQSERMLGFFARQKPNYVGGYKVDGTPVVDYKPTGLVAMNAVASFAARPEVGESFVRDLWAQSIPRGQWRYYDGLLYAFGLLHASGQYRIWAPVGAPARR